MEILSEKNEGKDSARDGLGVEDRSEVVSLRCRKEFMFFHTHIHTYTRTHAHTYTHIHIHTQKWTSPWLQAKSFRFAYKVNKC